ncbi:hypothetical protein GCM10009662_48500 [Catellatospora coxensis]
MRVISSTHRHSARLIQPIEVTACSHTSVCRPHCPLLRAMRASLAVGVRSRIRDATLTGPGDGAAPGAGGGPRAGMGTGGAGWPRLAAPLRRTRADVFQSA